MIRRPPISTLFPYPPPSRPRRLPRPGGERHDQHRSRDRRYGTELTHRASLEVLVRYTPQARLRGISHEDFQGRSEEHTSELQSLAYLVCRLLLEKKKKNSVY